jgi:hypothetical protein
MLIVLRDKFYAHFDKEKLERDVNIGLAEIDIILSLLKDFIIEIRIKVFSSQIDFDNDIFIQINKVMECVEERNKRYHDEIIRKFNEESKGI